MTDERERRDRWINAMRSQVRITHVGPPLKEEDAAEAGMALADDENARLRTTIDRVRAALNANSGPASTTPEELITNIHAALNE